MTQSPATPAQESLTPENAVRLREQLGSRFAKTRKLALQTLLAQGEPGWRILQETLLAESQGTITWLSGSIERALRGSGSAQGSAQGSDENSAEHAAQNSPQVCAFLHEHFPQGVVPLVSERGIDYTDLQAMLLAEDYLGADRLTNLKLCELAGPVAEKRKWVYFSDVPQFPITDLKTLDLLWQIYSEGNFGFSVQRELWLGVGQRWEQLWPKIGWKEGNKWTRYPEGFTWDLSAPRGHLPLFNQLRGVRVMDALMNHPAFAQG